GYIRLRDDPDGPCPAGGFTAEGEVHHEEERWRYRQGHPYPGGRRADRLGAGRRAGLGVDRHPAAVHRPGRLVPGLSALRPAHLQELRQRQLQQRKMSSGPGTAPFREKTCKPTAPSTVSAPTAPRPAGGFATWNTPPAARSASSASWTRCARRARPSPTTGKPRPRPPSVSVSGQPDIGARPASAPDADAPPLPPRRAAGPAGCAAGHATT